MDSLQFQKAEYAPSGPQCEICKAPITGEYFKVFGGHSAPRTTRNSEESVSTLSMATYEADPGSYSLCPACAAKVQDGQRDPSAKAFLRGLLYGAGAALACCIGYAAVIMITGLEIGLVSILVGYLVGKAVRQGSQGLGGMRCQIVAVVLTYLSITFSYIPVGIQQYSKQRAEEQAKGTSVQPEAVSNEPVTSGSLVLLFVTLAGLAITAPFLELTDGVSGALGIFIIGLGLQRAWAITGRDERVVSGPFQAEGVAGVD